MPAFDIKYGLVIQFEDFLFRKIKLTTTVDGVVMSVFNFDWLVLHEIMTREVRNFKKEPNQKKKKDCSWLQIKQQ